MENSEKYSYYSAEDRFVDDLKTIFLKALQYVDTSPDNHRIDNELVILISESLKKDEMRIDAVNSYLNKNKHFFDWINQSYLRVLEKANDVISRESKKINVALI